MIKVWVLVALVNNGHFMNNVVPTLVFETKASCERAIFVITKDTEGKSGTANLRCVEIEK